MINNLSQPSQNVLPIFGKPTQKSYRAAIADCVRHIKAKHKLTNAALAEVVGCSAETISNAENENTDLNAVIFLKLWYEFGSEEVSPVTDLATRRCEQPKTLQDRFNDIVAQVSALGDEVAGL